MLLLTVLLLVALVPLVRLTGGSIGTHAGGGGLELDSGAATTELESVEVFGTIRFSQAPATLEIGQGDDVSGLRKFEFPDTEHDFEFSTSSGGCDIVLSARWPGQTAPIAIEITVEPDGVESLSRTIWAEGQVDEIIGFTWK